MATATVYHAIKMLAREKKKLQSGNDSRQINVIISIVYL